MATDKDRMTPGEIAVRAAEQLQSLTGRDLEGIVGLESTDEGWSVRVEVVESRRVPDSADLLATYEVQVDGSGDLTGYRRLRRYGRGQTADEEHR